MLELHILFVISEFCYSVLNIWNFNICRYSLMSKKGMALLSWGLSFTHRLLGIRMPTQRETKDGSYIYQIFQEARGSKGGKSVKKIGHFTSSMTFKALLV